MPAVGSSDESSKWECGNSSKLYLDSVVLESGHEGSRY